MTNNDALVCELLPCPVCGDKPKWRGSRHDYAAGIYRLQCLGETHLFQAYGASEEKCIAAWNARPPLTPQPKPLDLPAQDEAVAVAAAVAQSTPQPGAVVNQCLAELGDAEPLVVSKEDDGWAVRTLSAWRLLHRAADDALREENARLRGALRDASVSLCWAARQMKGNCRGSDIDAVNLAAGRAANSAALEGGAK